MKKIGDVPLTGAERVKDYHRNLDTLVVVRIPIDATLGSGYYKDRLKEIVQARTGEPNRDKINLTKYVLDLIEADTGLKFPRGIDDVSERKFKKRSDEIKENEKDEDKV